MYSVRLMRGTNRPEIALFGLVLVATLVLAVPASAADVSGSGISVGPARVCPSPTCTCMPESQAQSLGYVRCSVNETPCFNDSFGRPLYCFGPPQSACGPGCDVSAPASQATGAGAGSIHLVITMQTVSGETTSCSGTGANSCAPTTGTRTPSSTPTDPISAVVNFIKSLCGMK